MKYIYIMLLSAALVTSINAQHIVHKEIYVGGLCGMCEDDILRICYSFDGVAEAEWSSDDQTLYLSYDNDLLDLADVEQKLAANGRDTENFTADQDAYDRLPLCCQYRNDEDQGSNHSGHSADKDQIAMHSRLRNQLQGVVIGGHKGGAPLVGANIYWAGTSEATYTDEQGYFSIPISKESNELVVSYVGYPKDTLQIDEQRMIEIELDEHVDLHEVVIVHREGGISYSYLSTARTQEIRQEELLFAACCNISESFETNATVDASHTDAISGTRQIKMLGLAGPYIMISRENMPDTRGLSALQGLVYTPGSWVEGIQINTGVGTVVNGYESITGQINIELIKPRSDNPLYVNLYQNQAGRSEGNINIVQKLNEKWSSALLLHGLIQQRKNDQNNDGFLDNPLAKRFILLNRYKWSGENSWEGQFGFRFAYIGNESGQLTEDTEMDRPLWLSKLNNRHWTAWTKLGKIITPTSSVGIQLSASAQDQNAFYGNRPYMAEHENLYANLIYQGIISNSFHKIKVGGSFMMDRYAEIVGNDNYLRNEQATGVFAEYTYDPSEKFSTVFGFRGDYHNNYGFFTTPKFHLRYMPAEESVFRIAVGRGLKTANIFAENIALFATGRDIVIQPVDDNNPYGLNPEKAWTMGMSYSQGIYLSRKHLSLDLDMYRTAFEDQVVVDYDASPQTVEFYNLNGRSWSNNLQISISSYVHDLVEIRLAYRYNDAKVDYTHGRRQVPYTAEHRGFFNVRYEDQKGWALNYTWNYIGAMRLPSTSSNPQEYQMRERSPNYTLSNIQLSKSWSHKFDVYLGAENIFDYRQDKAIIDVDNPFGDFFDASMIWAPIFGRNVYAGLRWRLKSEMEG